MAGPGREGGSNAAYWRILGLLERVRKSKSGYEAACPGPRHGDTGDRHPSLSVGVGLDGRVLLHCHVGCEPGEVLRALGLDWNDLFEHSAAGNPVRRFRLPDRNGTVVAEHVREDAPNGKIIHWERNGRNGLGGLPVENVPLYGLPQLLEADAAVPVVVCEGEKAAQALLDAGTLAVATVTGAGGVPTTAVLEPLQGREVWLWADNDLPGLEHMRRISDLLQPRPRWIDWAAAPPHGDAADYLVAGGRVQDIAGLLRPEASESRPEAILKGPRIEEVAMGEVEPETVRWLWRNRFARGKATLLMGDPGLGKSLITHWLAAIVSSGGLWPDTGQCEVGNVLLFTVEDGLADTVKPRLMAAMADMRRVFAVRGVINGETSADERMFTLEEHLVLLEESILRREISLVVMDPISAYLGPNVNSHREADVRAVLGPLQMLAERTGIALVLVMHLNKGTGVSALYRAAGSIAFPAACRVVLGVAPDPNDDSGKRRLLLPVKFNIAPGAEGIGYRIEQAPGRLVLPHADECDQPPMLVWDDEPVYVDATSAMDRSGTVQEMGALAECKRALEQILDLAGGRVLANEGRRQLKDADALPSNTTLGRARRELGIRSTKEGYQGAWYWERTKNSPSRVNDNPDGLDSLTTYGTSIDTIETNQSKPFEIFPRARDGRDGTVIRFCPTCGRNLTPDAYEQHLPCQQFARPEGVKEPWWTK